MRLMYQIIKGVRKKVNKRKYLRTMCMSLGTAMGIGNITGVASTIANRQRRVLSGCGYHHFWSWERSMQRFFRQNTAMTTRKIRYISKGIGSRKLAAVFLKNDFISGRFRIGIHLGNMENEQKIKVT